MQGSGVSMLAPSALLRMRGVLVDMLRADRECFLADMSHKRQLWRGVFTCTLSFKPNELPWIVNDCL
jgi:hypothetical protein